jgi:CheY-like chemotaxis protein
MTGDAGHTLERLEQEVHALLQSAAAFQQPCGPPAPPAPARRRRALLVEDDVNECELLAGFLRLAGLEVSAVHDGSEALDYLQREGADVVLLDMHLPRCDGPTMIRALRRNPAYTHLKIFAVTGATAEQVGLDPSSVGIARWFQKPLDPDALLRELQNELAQAP